MVIAEIFRWAFLGLWLYCIGGTDKLSYDGLLAFGVSGLFATVIMYGNEILRRLNK